MTLFTGLLTALLCLLMFACQCAALVKNGIIMYSGNRYKTEFPFYLEKTPEHFGILGTMIISTIIIALSPEGLEILMVVFQLPMSMFVTWVFVAPIIALTGSGFSGKEFFKKAAQNYLFSMRYIGICPKNITEDMWVSIDKYYSNPRLTTIEMTKNENRDIYKFKTISRFFVTKIVVHESEKHFLSMLNIRNIHMEKLDDSYAIYVTTYKLTTLLMNFIHKKSGRVYYTQNYKLHRLYA